jgi:hypothetical protein
MNVRMAATVAVATLLGSLGVAGTALGAGYPPEAVRAMGERYEAMARHDRGAPAPGYSAQALRALNERWAAMAHHYRQADRVQLVRVSQAATPAKRPAWLVALTARSEALNRHYGLGAYASERVKSIRRAATPAWKKALLARSDGLNRRHGLGKYAQP